ncbi:hypothetical protein L6452_14049 [Arctium lappa]|uniref:Uncharacterized protein n=1 Tax=Arctium lappa TaxID=4217 RepID=A0ACB9CK08_ARCLA|nr:hypothetical protein L6452_14049 [Arctium lappa]
MAVGKQSPSQVIVGGGDGSRQRALKNISSSKGKSASNHEGGGAWVDVEERVNLENLEGNAEIDPSQGGNLIMGSGSGPTDGSLKHNKSFIGPKDTENIQMAEGVDNRRRAQNNISEYNFLQAHGEESLNLISSSEHVKSDQTEGFCQTSGKEKRGRTESDWNGPGRGDLDWLLLSMWRCGVGCNRVLVQMSVVRAGTFVVGCPVSVATCKDTVSAAIADAGRPG